MDGEKSNPSFVEYPKWVHKFLRADSVDIISQTVHDAESNTEGEIVPMLVHNSAIVSPFWRRFVPSIIQDRLVMIRAELEFHRMNLQSTAGRTGILLFVSYDEHKAVVLADTAISQKLSSETWSEVIAILLSGIKNKDATQGYCEAIKKCGSILQTVLPAQHKNPNEFSNRFIIKE